VVECGRIGSCLIALLSQQFDGAAAHFTRGIELSIEGTFDYYLDACRLMRAFCYCRLCKFVEAEADLRLVEYENPVWVDKLRTKSELLEACRQRRLD